MENSLTRLERKYNDMMGIEDREKFGRAVAEYLLFIKSTSPFNNFIALEIKPFYIKDLYKQLNEVIIKYQGLPRVMPFDFGDKQTVKSPLFVFHQNLVGKAQQQGMTLKVKIIITDNAELQGVSVEDNPSRQYLLSRHNTDRFLIIKYLLSNKQGKVVSEILKHFSRENDKENIAGNAIKKNIKVFNELLKEELRLDNDVILTSKSGNKNKYSLNENDYIFVLR